MRSFKKIDSEGRLCELRLVTPVRRDTGEWTCDFVILIDGVESKRKATYGVDAQQATELATDLFNLYKDDFELRGTL